MRETRELPLNQVSEETGLSMEYLEQLEAGKLKKVRKKTVRRLSKVLRLPVACVKMLGIDTGKIADKGLGSLALAVQNSIKELTKHKNIKNVAKQTIKALKK